MLDVKLFKNLLTISNIIIKNINSTDVNEDLILRELYHIYSLFELSFKDDSLNFSGIQQK